MVENNLLRGKFITASSAGALGVIITTRAPIYGKINNTSDKLAVLGGNSVRSEK
jgi:hypothetical protein